MNRDNRPLLTLEQIAQALVPFGIAFSEHQLLAVQKYVDILVAWNQSISLTTVDEPLEIVSRHFGESVFAGTFLQFRCGRLADVGTGAGFPGIALKIAFPDLKTDLLEPNLKKCAFLNEVKTALDLHGIEIHRIRYEEYRGPGELFDFICCRALGNYRPFLQWARRSVSSAGRVVLWLGTEDSILVSRTKGWIWDVPVKIPESRRRVILSGRPSVD